MLVLKRAPGQSIDIDGGIRITVVNVTPTHVSLGFDAPPATDIARTELRTIPPIEIADAKPRDIES